MLSPASLRVCCLAVMAPALTKADRRTNCLPVGLSDPFCVTKTVSAENRQDTINPSIKCASPLAKRKTTHKIWVRTNAADLTSNKNRISAIALRTEFLNGKLRLHVEPKSKAWHGTDARTVAATKVKLKYTMNKNNSSLKNMGLAKANTSLGLHSMKRMDRISQLSHDDKRNSSSLGKESGESLSDLTDPTSSDLETTFSIVRIVQPALEQSIEEVSSSSRNLITSSKHETFVSLTDSDISLPVLPDTTSDATDVAPERCKIPLSPDISTSLACRDSVLPISPSDTKCPLGASKVAGERYVETYDALDHQLSTLMCDVMPSNETDPQTVASLDEDKAPVSVSGPVSDTVSTDRVNSATAESSIPTEQENSNLADKVEQQNSVTPQISISTEKENSVTPQISVPTEQESNSSVDKTEQQNILTPEISTVTKKENSIAAPCDDGFSPFSPLSPRGSDIEAASPCSTFSSSSTLSADESLPLSSMDESADTAFISFPDSLLGADPKPRAEIPCNGYSRVPSSTIRDWFDNLSSPGHRRNNMHLVSSMVPSYDAPCCSLPSQDSESLSTLLSEHSQRLKVALKDSEALLRKYMIEHVQTQIRTVVAHFRDKFTKASQRQSASDTPKDLTDMKAELLQGENVKSLSTAALVSLVRKLEARISPAGLLQRNSIVQDGEHAEEPTVTIPQEDYADIRDTSNVLLANMKNLLLSADPEMTDSSDEGSDAETGCSLEDSIQKRALWNFMKERAALTSRSTWLIARIHELENQLNSTTGILKKVSASLGDVPFEEQADSESSATSTAGSGSQAVKRQKGLGRPVNGYLDHGFGNSHASTLSEKSCSRTRALKTSAFQKRKFLITSGMHLRNPKMAKLSTVSCECNCQDEMLPCVLCTGRYNCAQSVDPDALTLLDRVALLDPNFHPLLSFKKDIPLLMHFESILKKNEAQYQSNRPPSPILNHRRMRFDTDSNHYSDARSRSRKINRYARTLLSAKYRNKKHFKKHKLVFGKWRKFQNKSTFHARDRIRRLSVVSSASSHDSPVPSPGSSYEDGFGYDLKRRRDENQFDIDDVIIPYSSKRGRLVKFEFKDIEIPSWRSKAFENLQASDIEEDTSDAAFAKRHEGYEIEERKIIRSGGGAKCFFNTWQKRSSGIPDSRADSSGANTPDPVLLYDQDIMFQDNSQLTSNPPSPALSPPPTPGSANDDSQPAARAERKRSGGCTRRIDEPSTSRAAEYDEIAPYEPRVFPLSVEQLDELLAEEEYTKEDHDTDVTMSGPSCPASPESSASSTSTVEDEDIADPEWRVALREGAEQNIVLKFAKR